MGATAGAFGVGPMFQRPALVDDGPSWGGGGGGAALAGLWLG